MENCVLQISDNALWRMTNEQLNDRLVEICIANRDGISGPAQGHERMTILRILSSRGLR